MTVLYIKTRPLMLCLLLAMVLGCSHPLKSNLVEDYAKRAPQKIALLPLTFSDGALEALNDEDDGEVKARVKLVFDNAVRAKLTYIGYRLLPLEEGTTLDGDASSDKERIKEVASRVFADGVMVVGLKKWKTNPGALRTYLKVGVEGSLYSKDADLLWHASYTMKESAVSLDKESRELGVIYTFEPALERAIEALFVMLPSPPKEVREAEPEAEEPLFDWLQ